MKNITKVDEPINSNDRYLYAVVERLDVLIDALSKDKCDGSCKKEIAEVEAEVVKAVTPVKKVTRKAPAKKTVKGE